jgi:CheY-like chemotaxis protein
MAERLAALGSMAAGMQHEINNPLASVVANVQFTLDALRASPSGIDSAAIPELVTALREATEGAERVRRTVEDLRHFSRSAEGVDAAIDVTTALDEAVRMTAHTVRHHAAVHREYGATPPVRAEEGQLARVFVNLLLHAAEATGDGGAENHTIVLRTRTDAQRRAVVEVADDGPGIASETLHRVFDPFFKTQDDDPAIGLGLAICHSIVSSLGGEIEVESEVGAGTTFRVSLPAAEPDRADAPRSAPTPPAHAAAPTTSPAAAKRARVLIIDDEAAIGRALRRLLVSEHDVTVESDARAALTRLATETFDVVFCDLMMPHMSGMDFYAALSSTAPEQAARIVFLTGGAFSPRSVEFLRDNTNVCLSKPFSRDSVTSAIRALVTASG